MPKNNPKIYGNHQEILERTIEIFSISIPNTSLLLDIAIKIFES